MEHKLRKIGNGKGVIIPLKILEQSGIKLGDTVTFHTVGKQIIIDTPPTPEQKAEQKPRPGDDHF